MARIFIGNIGNDCQERDVERLFRSYGKVKNLNLKGQYGFLEFEDDRDADDAVKEINGQSFNGKRIRVEFANSYSGDQRSRFGGDRGGGPRDRMKRGNGGKARRTDFRLNVENLSTKTSWQDLKDFMRKAGDITYTNAHKPRSGEGRGMDYALEKLDNTEVDGRKIRLTEETKRGRDEYRDRSESRSRSRSRSRDKSDNYPSSSRHSGERTSSKSRDGRYT